MRIVSYNVRYFGHGLKGVASTAGTERRIAEALLALDPLPDVICLQEVETRSIRSQVANRSARESGVTQLEHFMTTLDAAFPDHWRPFPFDAFHFKAHAYRVRQTNLYTTGLAVIVNLKTLSVDTHNVERPEHITYHHVERWKERKQTRICAHMRLEDQKGRRFHLFNTHLSLPTPFEKEFWTRGGRMGHGVNQLAEAKTLATFVETKAMGDPFVICGDFNTAPGTPVFRYLVDQAGFESAQATLRQIDPETPKGFPTAGFMRMRMHLDHLFSGGKVRWVDLEGTLKYGDKRGRFYGLSDHVPLVARFKLPT